MSFLLAGAFAGTAALAEVFSAPALLVAMAWWLGTINLTLGLFNLVPAYPLDGGRVLRSALGRRRGDQESATLSAARTGEVFAIGLITFGLLDLASGGQRGGLWLTGIGWFLHSAARSERLAVVLRRALAGLLVDDAMTPLALTERGELVEEPAPDRPKVGTMTVARADEPLVDVIDRMAQKPETGPIVLVSDAQVVGILSADDIARALESAPHPRQPARHGRRPRGNGDRGHAVTNG